MKFEDYQKVGLQLKELNELLCDHLVETSGRVRQSSPVLKHGDKAMKALDVLRSELEEVMFIEYPPPKSTTYIFYGKTGSNNILEESKQSIEKSKKRERN
jgi:hypothetical protein